MFSLKWLRGHPEKEMLKKHYTLELFVFKLYQRIKLCPERNLDAVAYILSLGNSWLA